MIMNDIIDIISKLHYNDRRRNKELSRMKIKEKNK